jgi:hypothetical protein
MRYKLNGAHAPLLERFCADCPTFEEQSDPEARRILHVGQPSCGTVAITEPDSSASSGISQHRTGLETIRAERMLYCRGELVSSLCRVAGRYSSSS